MGYRSNVALVLSKDGVKFFHARLTAPTMNNDLQVCIRNFLNHADTYYADDSTGAEVWYWEWVKWYQDTGELELYFEGDFGLKGEIPAAIGELSDLQEFFVNNEQ